MLPKMYEYDSTPVIVEVFDGHYEVFSLSPVPTRRDLWLMSLIYDQGGISENVEAGNYFFSATRKASFTIKVTLTPFEE